ncbi:MAG: helix-turn-helix transcriptional regulator [Ignavibacteriaceae bacterium]|nr:helix-turn-helix transcriptional regulator [Ignavibacteriaceae bacterium]
MELKNNIKQLRFEKGQISQEDLAKALNVSRQTINAIENGRFNPSVVLAFQIAKFFKKKLEEIFSLEDK